MTYEGDPMARFLVWRGKDLVSSGNFHQAVLVGDKVYDAYTGAQGMLWSEYQVAMEHLGTLIYTVAP